MNEEELIPVPGQPVEERSYRDTDLDLQVLPQDSQEETEPFMMSPEEEEMSNLIPLYETAPGGPEFLKKLVQSCREEFDESWSKNKGYRDKTAQAWRLLYCDLPPKSKPYENCANVAIPLSLQNIVRYTNKIESEVFGDWSNVFNFVPTNPNAELIAPIVSEHSNWQIRTRVPGFKRQMARAILNFTVAGDLVIHSYYDEVLKRNVHETLTCDDFVTPYTHVSVAPDFSDVPWIARRFPMFKTKLKSMADKWSNVDKVLSHEAPEHGSTESDTPVREAVADFFGEDPFGQKRGEYEIIHYEGWLKLLGQDKERYCQLIFDHVSQTPLKLSIHESADYAERYRYQYQQNELQQFQQAQEQYQMMLAQTQQQAFAHLDQAAAEPPGSPNAPIHADAGRQMLQTPPPPPPQPPSWMTPDVQQPEPPRKTPIHMFAHGVCLEPMLGNHGIGIGRIDAQLNLGANTVFSQFIDAATLGNGKTFITASNVDFRSPFKIGPGVVNKAKNVMPSDLANAIIPLEFGQANAQLVQVASMLMEFGEQASSTPDLMSGAAGKSGETARGIQARIDQMNAMFQVPTRRFADCIVQVMRNNCKLNRVFMGEEEIFYVNRFNDDLEQGGPEMIKAAREFYDNEYEIELIADLQFKSRAQKVSEADEITQLPNAFPELQMNLAFKYQAIKNSLKARGMERMARRLLGPPPPLPQNTFGLPPGTPNTTISLDNPQLPPEQQQQLMVMQQQQAAAQAQQQQQQQEQKPQNNQQNGPPQ